MAFEIWAMDAGAGEAILRHGREWLLLTLDSGWQALPLHSAGEALRWTLSGSTLPIGKSYEDLEDAIEDVREACLAVIEGDAKGRLVPAKEQFVPAPQTEIRRTQAAFFGRALYRQEGEQREALFAEVIRAHYGRLERYLERQGSRLARPRDLALIVQAFEELYQDPKGWDDLAELENKLFSKVSELGRKKRPGSGGRAWDTPEWPALGSEAPLESRIGRRLGRLSDEALEVLATWTNLELSYWDIQVILNLPLQELERLIREAARALGMAAVLLRARLFAPACRHAAEGALGRKRPRQ